MLRFLFSFSGGLERRPYLLLTCAFLLLAIAATLADPVAREQPFTHLLSASWKLGAGVDKLVLLEPPLLDVAVSLAIIVPSIWIWSALTVRRLRELGQSPWWVLVIGGAALPVMLALSFARSPREQRASGVTAPA